MNASDPFDDDVQMFREDPREPSLAYLRFLRWLAEHGLLEHSVSGPPGGELVPALRMQV